MWQRGVWWLLLWVGLLTGCAPSPGDKEGRYFRSAQVRLVSAEGEERRTVTLPFFWDREMPGRSGQMEFTLQFDLPRPLPERYGLFVANMSNQYRVLLNGAVVDEYGKPGHSEARLPRWMPLDGFVQPGANELRIELLAHSGYRAGLGPVMIDGREATRFAFEAALLWRYWWRIGVVSFCLVVGGLGLLLWWLQHRRMQPEAGGAMMGEGRLYLYSAMAEFSFAFMALYTLVEAPALGTRWAATAFAMAVSTWSTFVILFGVEVLRWPRQGWRLWWRRWLWLMWCLGLVVAVFAWNVTQPALMGRWYPVLSVSSLLFFAMALWQCWRRGADLAEGLLVVALAVNVVAGVVETYRQRYAPSLDGGGVMYYTALLFGVVSMLVVGLRFRAALQANETAAQRLSAALIDKEAELQAGYERMTRLQTEQAKAAERTGILRDMHDGVGMHLNVALRQLRQGHADHEAVATVLQEGLDQLKLSIDALNVPAGDVVALLANLRYRLEPRLRGAGLVLEWLVDDIAPLVALDDKAMRHLQFALYAALANVLQHAQARRVTVLAQAQAASVRLAICDDGVGFDASALATRGLRAMRDRVQSIGGQLEVSSEPGCTVVSIVLPTGPSRP